MKKIIAFWKRTSKETSWKIFYRQDKKLSILEDDNKQFIEYQIGDKNKWAADPLVFETSKGTFLFFELFDKKTNKGSIACSAITDGKIGKYEIVLDEPFHLSFPFVFEFNDSFYMIPETGAKKQIILYKALDFPYKWRSEKVLLENINSSDNIVFFHDKTLFLLSSIIYSTASCCSNLLFNLDKELRINDKIIETPASVDGARNAGPILAKGDKLIRVGQFCPNNEYGKGLCFFEINNDNGIFSEKLLKIILPNDISFPKEDKYFGVHTYSYAHNLEFIDAKVTKKRYFLVRLSILIKRIFSRK